MITNNIFFMLFEPFFPSNIVHSEPEVESVPFLTSFTPNMINGLRNDWANNFGFQFVVGSAPLIVTHLGRWIFSGNNQLHTIRILDAGLNIITSIVINAVGKIPNEFNYVQLPVSVTLSAYQTYIVESSEGLIDVWANSNTVTSTVDGNSIISIYTSTNTAIIDQSYVAPNFKYHL